MGITTPLRVVASGAGAAVDRIDRILSAVEVLAVSIRSIEQDMRGMRSDLREVIDGVAGLKVSVDGLDGSVVGIRETTAALDARVIEVQESLTHVDALARSVPRIGRRAARARQSTTVVPVIPVDGPG